MSVLMDAAPSRAIPHQGGNRYFPTASAALPSVSSPMHYTWRYPAAVFLVLAMTGPAVAQELDNRRGVTDHRS